MELKIVNIILKINEIRNLVLGITNVSECLENSQWPLEPEVLTSAFIPRV